MGSVGDLSAPFPYFGGKSSWAALIDERLGDVGVYGEPFAGTWIVGLRRRPSPREVMCELNGFIVNFYQGAMKYAPDETAEWADWPTNHHDLTAWHRWLLRWGAEHREALVEDPEWYDCKAAGRWVWGQSSWIGQGWCDNHGQYDRQPHD